MYANICYYLKDISYAHYSGLPLVREKSGKFKVREKSGNFRIGQGNLEFCVEVREIHKKSGKIEICAGVTISVVVAHCSISEHVDQFVVFVVIFIRENICVYS